MLRPLAIGLAGAALAASLPSPVAAEPAPEAREALAARLVDAPDEAARDAVRRDARRRVLAILDREVLPAWLGTPWGTGPRSTARTPHQTGRTVGCSAFVVAALENAGFRFADRGRFIRSRALPIQHAFARRAHRFADLRADQLAASIAELGDGLYLIGLARHIGFVRVRGGSVDIIHAGRSGPAAVQREPLELSPPVIASRPSGYWVSEVLTDEVVDRWLLGRRLALR